MNDQPNLRQFLDEVNSFAEEPAGAPVPAKSGQALPPIGKVLEIAGYTEEEKLQIATDHLVGKQVKNHGLTDEFVRFTPDALRQVIRGYTREAGVRNLEREIGALCRKVARRRAEGDEKPIEITPEDLTGTYLFLASDCSRPITRQVLVADAGQSKH